MQKGVDERLTNEIREVDRRLSERMDGLDLRMDKLENRVDNMDARFSTRFDNLQDKIEYVQADVEMLKRVAADHHEQLKKLNKSQQ